MVFGLWDGFFETSIVYGVYSVGDDGGLRSKGTKAKKVVCVLVLVSVLKVAKFVWGCGRKASALLGLCDVHRLWW